MTRAEATNWLGQFASKWGPTGVLTLVLLVMVATGFIFVQQQLVPFERRQQVIEQRTLTAGFTLEDLRTNFHDLESALITKTDREAERGRTEHDAIKDTIRIGFSRLENILNQIDSSMRENTRIELVRCKNDASNAYEMRACEGLK